ncbi:MAG: N-acetyl-gamma-glutamyl-phosphate reductase [Candidatus Omnitrophota bacterium]
MLKVGIIGARGYTGEELIRLLLKHPDVRLTYLAATLDKAMPIDEVFPSLKGLTNLKCENFSYSRASEKCDLLFLALPHTVSMEVVPKLAKMGKKIIDLSADYRLKNYGVYKQWYHKAHKDKKNLKKFVYGLPELYREKIKKSDFVANPGCYPTASILGIVPALVSGLADADGIIIDAKSGVSGAGKKTTLDFSFCELNGNFKGYKFNVHQHSPEINQELSKVSLSKVNVVFCPHLLPVKCGIYATIYIRLKSHVSTDKIADIYKKFYKLETFIRVRALGSLPELKDVVGTNYCDIGLVCDEARKLLIVTSVIDNLIKGASGQAVQNMNIMCGFNERTALS